MTQQPDSKRDGREPTGSSRFGRRARGVVGRAFLLATLACIVAAPPGASAQSDVRQSALFQFAEQQPDVPSALILNIDYVNPDDPSAKPHAVQTVVEQLAAGAQIDTSVPELCTAADAQLIAQGAAACPPGSRVGTGSIRIDSGFPEPARFIDADVVFLNNTDELIFVSTERDSGARVVSRSTVQGGQIVNSAPPLPGTPPDGGAIDVVQARLDAIARNVGGVNRGYVTTPRQCPPSGAWTNWIDFTYRDGITQRVNSESPCRASAPASPAKPAKPAKDCRCQRLRKKSKRQKRKLKQARSGSKRSTIQVNRQDTRRRLRKLGCRR